MLVEGPPDMISARSQGLPAIAVPGNDAWEPAWAQLLTGRRVFIVFDCDPPGRQAARRIVGDLHAVGVRAGVIDLAGDRADGYDLTDWLADRGPGGGDELAARIAARPATRRGLSERRR